MDKELKICGVDEAGRGPLAGPVFAAAVVLHKQNVPYGLKDSKKLSEKARRTLYQQICRDADDFAIANVSAEQIDSINILRASLLAMAKAVNKIKTTYSHVLVDGLHSPYLGGKKVYTVIKGDSKVAEISAASILAKVARDDYMCHLDLKYPEFKFAQHKGYPTQLHLRVLKTYGPTEEHRKTFKPVKLAIKSG